MTTRYEAELAEIERVSTRAYLGLFGMILLSGLVGFVVGVGLSLLIEPVAGYLLGIVAMLATIWFGGEQVVNWHRRALARIRVDR